MSSLTTGVMFGQFWPRSRRFPVSDGERLALASTGKPRYGLQKPHVSVFRFWLPSSSRPWIQNRADSKATNPIVTEVHFISVAPIGTLRLFQRLFSSYFSFDLLTPLFSFR